MKDYCYVLKLEDNCYYVGYTCDIVGRLKTHWSGLGARWTRLHKPLYVMMVVQGECDKEFKTIHDDNDDDDTELKRYESVMELTTEESYTIDFDGKPMGDSAFSFELLLTMDMMLAFGIDRVRGSRWTKVEYQPSKKLNVMLCMRQKTLHLCRRNLSFDVRNNSFDFIITHKNCMQPVLKQIGDLASPITPALYLNVESHDDTTLIDTLSCCDSDQKEETVPSPCESNHEQVDLCSDHQPEACLQVTS